LVNRQIAIHIFLNGAKTNAEESMTKNSGITILMSKNNGIIILMSKNYAIIIY
jgi:hypothetical protein